MEAGDSKIEGDSPPDKKSYAGIPEAQFLDDVDAYMAKPENNEDCSKVLKMLDESRSKYKFMEYNLISKRRRLMDQIPNLEDNLQMIDKLQAAKNSDTELETQFVLSNHVYAKAVVPPVDRVNLWLGANVMLEFTLEEAKELLMNNIEEAKKNLSHIEHDLDFLKDQFTTTEVNMARVYNWDIKKRMNKNITSGMNVMSI